MEPVSTTPEKKAAPTNGAAPAKPKKTVDPSTLKQDTHKKQHGKGARERLQLYARKMPYRDPALARREAAPPPREVKP